MQSTIFSLSEAQFSCTEMEKLPFVSEASFVVSHFTQCVHVCLNNSNDSFQFLSIF